MNRNNVVRLTESKLRNMIRESVRQVLNEMDPRAYASARDKAAARGQFDRASRFHDTAVDAYNQQQGFDKFDRGYDGAFWKSSLKMNNDGTVNYNDENDTGFTNFTSKQHYNPHTGTIEFIGNLDGYGRENPVQPGAQRKVQKTGKKTLKQIPQYRVAKEMADGSGKYIKGQGWQ